MFRGVKQNVAASFLKGVRMPNRVFYSAIAAWAIALFVLLVGSIWAATYYTETFSVDWNDNEPEGWSVISGTVTFITSPNQASCPTESYPCAKFYQNNASNGFSALSDAFEWDGYGDITLDLRGDFVNACAGALWRWRVCTAIGCYDWDDWSLIASRTSRMRFSNARVFSTELAGKEV